MLFVCKLGRLKSPMVRKKGFECSRLKSPMVRKGLKMLRNRFLHGVTLTQICAVTVHCKMLISFGCKHKNLSRGVPLANFRSIQTKWCLSNVSTISKFAYDLQ